MLQFAENITLYVSDGDRLQAVTERLHGCPRVGQSEKNFAILPCVAAIILRDVSNLTRSGHLYHIHCGQVGQDLHILLKGGSRASKRPKLLKAGANYLGFAGIASSAGHAVAKACQIRRSIQTIACDGSEHCRFYNDFECPPFRHRVYRRKLRSVVSEKPIRSCKCTRDDHDPTDVSTAGKHLATWQPGPIWKRSLRLGVWREKSRHSGGGTTTQRRLQTRWTVFWNSLALLKFPYIWRSFPLK